MGKRELIALLNLSSWCLVMVERRFLAVSRGCLQFVIVVFPDHTHLLFLYIDENGIIRCKGRIDEAGIIESARRPVWLPKSVRLTHLLIEKVHRQNTHS